MTLKNDANINNLFAAAAKWGGLFMEEWDTPHGIDFAEAVLYYGRAIVALASIRSGVEEGSEVYNIATREMSHLQRIYRHRYTCRGHFDHYPETQTLVFPYAYQDEDGAWHTYYAHKRVRSDKDLRW